MRKSDRRLKKRITSLLLAVAMPFSQVTWAQPPSANQLPTGGKVTAGEAAISQSGAQMNINQSTSRAVIDWQSFDIGSNAQVNFNQPSFDSVALNRVLNGDPTQIFGHLTANGQVFLTNAAGVYFAPGASVNVGGLLATTHAISNNDFMAGRDYFYRNGATGFIINEGSMTASLGGYIALLAPEVRNEGVVIAQMGTVALGAGETYELRFNNQGHLTDVTVTKSDIAALIENKQVVEAPGGLIIMSAQAANHLQGGVVKNSGTIEATGMVDDGGTVRLVASDEIDLQGQIKTDAAAGSSGNGGTVTAIADLSNPDSTITLSGSISARGGDAGGNGGSVETSGSHFQLERTALVDTSAAAGKTGNWLIDPYNYTIDASAATAIDNALNTSNVTVTTTADIAGYGSNGNNASTGNITVSSAISSASNNALTLTAANAIDVDAAISTGSLILTGPGGITLNDDLSTITGMTLNGNVTLGADVTLTSGVSDTYTSYTDYVVPVGVTELTATLVGGAGGKGGTDTSTGGDTGAVGVLTASFGVTGGEDIYIAPGSGGVHGGNQVTNTGGSAGGTNQFNLGNGGKGGDTGPQGNSGGGAGGGAATVLALTSTPDSTSQLLVAGGGGGGGGSGNNTACPSLCAGQNSVNYLSSGMTGQDGYNAGNGASPINDGGGSGGGGGGLLGGKANNSIFFVNEWTGRGGNVGSSGGANSFVTDSLGISSQAASNSANGYAIISYGGGTVNINGTINGSHALNILARSSDVNISGAIGGSSALSALNITGAQGIGLSGGAVTTTGAQTYTGPLTLNANTTNFATTNSGVTFAGTILKGSGVTSNLTVNAGSGNVSLNGQTGSSSTPIGAINITSTGTTSLAGAVYAASLTKSGSGTTTVSGGLVQTLGGQSYGGILDLGGATTLNSTGTGDILLNAAVSNSTQSNLTIDAAGGNVTLNGNLAVGTNARPTSIGDVSISASGIVTLGSSGTPISVDARSLTISSNAMNIYADSGTSFTCGTGSSAAGVCLTNTASFTMAADSTFSGPLEGTTSLTKAGAGALTLTGVSTYTGNTTVNAGKLEIAGTGKLGNGSYAGNIAVNGVNSQVRFNNSVNQTLSGTMSGTGFINSPGSGVTDITTLSDADHYNLVNAYVVPTSSLSGSSSYYGDAPTFSYQLATTAAGGAAITDASPSGTAILNGTPTSTSNAGNYTISYASGLTLGSERYNLMTGNNLSWTIAPRPLTVTVSKVYDGSASFSSGFSLSGMVNGDAAPTLSGDASVSSSSAGTYTGFAGSTLSQTNSNYTLTGASIDATISPHPLNITVIKRYDGGDTFSTGFQLSGMLAEDSDLTVSGSASVANPTAGTYTSFSSNNLVFSNPSYTVAGGSVSATILPGTQATSVPVMTQVTIPQSNTITAPELKIPDTVSNPTLTGNNSSVPPSTHTPNTSSNTGTTSNISTTSNPITASSVPSANTQGISASAQNGITVSLVKEPSAQEGGMVSVMVPDDIVMNTGGFSFVLPQKISITGSSNVRVTTMSGDPLPSWIQFNPVTKTFIAANVPAGGLPIHVVVSTEDTQTTIVISKSQ